MPAPSIKRADPEVINRSPLALPVTLIAGVFCATSLLAQAPPSSPGPTPLRIDAGVPYHQARLPIEQRIADLLSRMTLEEKVGQLGLHGLARGVQPETVSIIRAGGMGACMLNAANSAAACNQAQQIAVDESRLGIPILFAADVIHGYRTTFPISLGLSCAWSPELFEKAQTIAARESRANGVSWVFAPMSEVARDPRWGRVAETCGEDPYLAARCVEGEVRGFQGGDPAAAGRVGACLKHFVGYSGSVGGRDYNETQIPEFNLRNIFLPPFEAGVRAGALSIMSSFNANDGIPSTANAHWLTGILRGEWDFKGVVVSDAASVGETIAWGYSADRADAARLCVSAGTDMELGVDAYRLLAGELKAGRIRGEIVDEAVRRVLRLKFVLGLFDHPFTDEPDDAHADLPSDAIALARECVARSCVLLKNQGGAALPLPRAGGRKVALIGPFGDDPGEMLGCWPGCGRNADVVTLAAGIRAKLPADTSLQVVKGCGIEDGPAHGVLHLRAAREADTVVMALGEPRGWTGENASRATLGLTGRQQELFDAVAATGKPMTVVLFCGRVLAAPGLIDKAAAVLIAWQPGIQAGNGLADVLFGDAAPTGRLTMSWPSSAGQLPIYYNGYTTGRPQPSFASYRDLPGTPLFQFGYGLTYTTFAYGSASVAPGAKGEPDVVRASVTNMGKRAGEETVQLYIHQAACAEGARPAQELRGFVHLTLQPGEEESVSFPIARETLGYWGRDGKFRTDKGRYQLWIAPEARAGQAVEYQGVF